MTSCLAIKAEERRRRRGGRHWELRHLSSSCITVLWEAPAFLDVAKHLRTNGK